MCAEKRDSPPSPAESLFSLLTVGTRFEVVPWLLLSAFEDAGGEGGGEKRSDSIADLEECC